MEDSESKLLDCIRQSQPQVSFELTDSKTRSVGSNEELELKLELKRSESVLAEDSEGRTLDSMKHLEPGCMILAGDLKT